METHPHKYPLSSHTTSQLLPIFPPPYRKLKTSINSSSSTNTHLPQSAQPPPLSHARPLSSPVSAKVPPKFSRLPAGSAPTGLSSHKKHAVIFICSPLLVPQLFAPAIHVVVVHLPACHVTLELSLANYYSWSSSLFRLCFPSANLVSISCRYFVCGVRMINGSNTGKQVSGNSSAIREIRCIIPMF